MAVAPEVEAAWTNFWKPLVCLADGSLDLDAVKNELYDFQIVLHEVGKVYDDVTNGRISKPNTAAIHVIQEVDERIQRTVDEAVKEEMDWLRSCGVDLSCLERDDD